MLEMIVATYSIGIVLVLAAILIMFVLGGMGK